MNHGEVCPRCKEESSRCDVAFIMMSQKLGMTIGKCRDHRFHARACQNVEEEYQNMSPLAFIILIQDHLIDYDTYKIV